MPPPPPIAPSLAWEFQESRKSDTWKPFDEASARLLTQAAAEGSQQVSLTLGNGTQYAVDLSNPANMTQTNTKTNWVRSIRCLSHATNASAATPARNTASFVGVGAGASASHSAAPPEVARAAGRTPFAPDQLLAHFAPNGSCGVLPSSWVTNGKTPVTHDVPSSSQEFQLVVTHLKATLNAGRNVKVGAVSRVENAKVFHAFKLTEGTAIMFHGCHTEKNEASIINVGFQVHMCKSGGNNFGTWLAYNASYSDGGRYVFQDANGWRHLFVCVASKHGVKKDNEIMRVVGQGGAAPLWIVRYCHK